MRYCAWLMDRMTPLQGDLQMQVMQTVWRLESATVDQVRSGLPEAHRGAYNTVQTVLNRLTERGLLERERVGKSFQYRPRLTETEYLWRSIQSALAGASSDARQAALAEVIGRLETGELSELRRRAKAIERARQER